MNSPGSETGGAKSPASPPEAPKVPSRRIRVEEILGGAREAVILHGHEEYRLRLTRNGKLILTK